MAMARRGLFYTFLALYLRVVLGLSVTETTLLASLSMIANSVSQTFIWGRISDKYQVRTIFVVIGETIAAVGYVLVYFLHISLLNTSGPITAAYSIIAGLTFLEFFWSMSNMGWSALISDLTASKERGKLMSVVSSVGGVGRIVGISVSGLLYDWGGEAAGFRNGSLFFFASGIMIVSAIVIWLSVHPSEQESKKSKSIASIVSTKNAKISSDRASRVFYWFLASIFIIGLGAYSILQILVFYVELDSPIGAKPFDIAMIRNSASIATIVASLLAGYLAKRVGRKNALGIGFILTVVTPLLYICAQDTSQMMVVNSLSGISMALIGVVGYLVASELIPTERRGTLFGLYNAITYISFGVAGTVIGGPIADHLINAGFAKKDAYIATFWVASFISLAGLVMYALTVKSGEKRRQNQLQVKNSRVLPMV